MKTINLNIDKLGNITIDLDLKVNAYLLLEETKKPKQLFYEILKDNFKKPKLTKKIFSKIDKKDLKNIGMLIIEANNLKEFYKDYKGKSFYYNFKMTLLKSKKSIEKNKLIIDISNLNKNEFISTLNNISTKVFEEINKFSEILSNYFKESVQEYFDKIGPNGENIVEILAEKNWVFPLDSPSYLASSVILLYENKQYDKIDNLMLDLVKKEDLENFTNKWFNLKYFRKRENILKAGIKAHIDGNYELSIYTLLPHIEGIIWDFLMNFEDKDKLQSFASDIKEKIKHFADYYYNNNIEIDFMIKPFFEKIISEKFPLYKSENFLNISEEYDQINRHILSHGIVTKCISEINSLKLIYILDFFWHIIDISEKRKAKIFLIKRFFIFYKKTIKNYNAKLYFNFLKLKKMNFKIIIYNLICILYYSYLLHMRRILD